ncbi:hypothetical protein [Kordia sp.]|uniref:hypothetical protein n=1 Tax=Kordia sp. TaxID=1965332 RepID=UPI003B5BF71F
MKHKIIFLVIVLGIFAFSCEPKLSAEAIIEKSIENAHGGMTQWETPKMLVYEKVTTLYDSLRTIELEKKQTFYNTLQPEFTSKVIWEENGKEKRIVFDGKETHMFIDGFQVTDDEKVAAAHEEILGAQYVFWQPYKLLVDDVSLTSEGIIRLEDGKRAYSVKAVYPNSENIWWYYFDAETFLLKENLVKHGTTYSHIKNLKHETKTGLFLNKERKSFMVDVVNNQKYLRAHYHYNILELK